MKITADNLNQQTMTGPEEVRIEPVDQDVLCGKSKECVNAPGSKRLRDVIESYRFRYDACTSKYSKMVITKEIYDNLSTTSRFLKLNEKTQRWEEVSPMAARDKIGHSLRFANRKTRRQAKMTGITKKRTTTLHKRSVSHSSVETADTAISSSSSSTTACSSPVYIYSHHPSTKDWGSLKDHLQNASTPSRKPLSLLHKPRLPSPIRVASSSLPNRPNNGIVQDLYYRMANDLQQPQINGEQLLLCDHSSDFDSYEAALYLNEEEGADALQDVLFCDPLRDGA